VKWFLLLLVAFLTLVGCSSKSRLVHTGFLKGYENLKPLSTRANHLIYKESDANLSAYTKLYIPEIKVLSLSPEISPYDRELYAKVSAYCTASYKKLISKKSANYELVGVGQKGTLVLEVALSLVDGNNLDKAKAVAFVKKHHNAKLYEEGRTHLLVEVKTRDAMNNKVLVQSMRLMDEKKIKVTSKQIQFKDLQPALDAWLAQLIR